ncbi:MAG TPA: hypothetical protein VFM63_15410 [Pyrinomonadaceae bacterium]|nr:hypothetical protein [Pyrinomonadaceae bacterium]
MKTRPVSITIISWFFLIFGSIALISGLLPFIGADRAHLIAEFKTHWMVHLSRLVQIAAGLFLLRGHNWARWLLAVWMAFHLVVGAMHGWIMFLTHLVFFTVISFFLFRWKPQRIPTNP